MRSFVRNNGPALGLYLLLIAVACFFIFTQEKNDLHLFVNQYVGNRYLNGFFFWATFLGDGWTAPFLIVMLAIVNARAGLSAVCAWLLAAAVTSVLKYYFFDDAHRPYFIFQYFDRRPLNIVEGVNMHIHNSFPSGHATQAFAVFMSMTWAARKHAFKILFVLCAAVSAFSRVYLSQHWLVDIVAGSLIGTGASLLFYFIYIYRDRLRRADRPLPALIRRKQR